MSFPLGLGSLTGRVSGLDNEIETSRRTVVTSDGYENMGDGYRFLPQRGLERRFRVGYV